MNEPRKKRQLTADDIAELARADALFDQLSKTQLRNVAEWLLLGLAFIRPTNQDLKPWLDALERHVRAHDGATR